MEQYSQDKVVASVEQELGSNSLRTENITAAMNLIAKMEKVKLGRSSEIVAATFGGGMKAFDRAYDRYDIRTARKNAEKIDQALAGIPTKEELDDATVERAIEFAAENLNPESYSALQKLSEAQAGSINQRSESSEVLSTSELEDLTRRKGANSVLILALEVNPEMKESRRICYEELGFLMQLLDDYTDKELDSIDGVITLAHNMSNADFVTRIKEQYVKVKRMFEKEYEAYQLVDLNSYIDKLVARVGLVF